MVLLQAIVFEIGIVLALFRGIYLTGDYLLYRHLGQRGSYLQILPRRRFSDVAGLPNTQFVCAFFAKRLILAYATA